MSNHIPRLELITDYLDYHGENSPAAPAVSHDGRTLSYGELKQRVDELARALLAAGIQRGDRVATLSPPHPDFLITFLATASIGGVWLGLNPRYTRGEYAYVLADAAPAILFCRTRIGDRDYRADIAGLAAECPALRQLVVLSGDPLPDVGGLTYDQFLANGSVPEGGLEARRASCTGSDPALLVYTSGSTGAPKGALLPHRGLVSCCLVQSHYWNASPARILNFLPINHVGCVGDISSFLLVSGGCNVFLEQFDARRCMELIEQERITIWGGIPTTIEMCLDLPEIEQFDLSSIQMIVWSGAAASVSLIQRMLAITPRLSTSYGLTESVGSITYAEVGASPEVLAHTIGAPAPEYGFRIAGPDGAEVQPGEHGEIQLRGDFLMLGYLNRPGETAEAIDADGWLHTGDLALRRADGNVQLVGRIKDMFKSGGYNVYPREIEIVLESHSGVAMAAVVSAADPLYGETGHAFVIPAPGVSLDVEELRAFCREFLANYKIPKTFTIAAELPLLPVGKVDKKALQTRLAVALGNDGQCNE